MSVKSGRPRDPHLDAAVAAATCALLAEGGYAATTVEAVARRAGTSRPAIYRRHRHRADLVVAALVDRFGADPTHDTGRLRTDLEDLQRHQRELFTDPVLQGALGGLLAEVSTDPHLASLVSRHFLAPRRAATIRILERAAQRGEIEPGVDGEWICDLLTGPLLMRAVLPGLPALDEAFVRATVEAALMALGIGEET